MAALTLAVVVGSALVGSPTMPAGSQELAAITGHVTDPGGTGATRAFVEIVGPNGYDTFTTPVVPNDGSFVLDVPPGTYLLRSTEDRQSTYYPGVEHPADATPIVVGNADIADLDFTQIARDPSKREYGRCDLNGDGLGDALVGVPLEDVADVVNAGTGHVLYGQTLRLRGAASTVSQKGTIADRPEPGDRFAAAVTCGDFDGDGYSDGAFGVPAESSRTRARIGVVHVLSGGPAGVTAAGNQLLHQKTPGSSERPQRNDRFGSSLASADFDGDGFFDLAVGVPGEDASTGVVQVFYGSADGLAFSGRSQVLVPGPSIERGARFGFSLAAGDRNGDAFADLVVGAPFDDVGGATDAGSIHLFNGGFAGIGPVFEVVTQSTHAVPDDPEDGDRFGFAVELNDAPNVGQGVVVVGVPGETPNGAAAGAVWVDEASFIIGQRGNMLSGADFGVPGTAGDELGAALVLLDRAGTSNGRLAIGAPGTQADAGAVYVAVRSGGSLRYVDGEKSMIDQGVGVSDRPAPGDRFGQALGRVWAPTFDGVDRFVVAAPGERTEGVSRAGIVHELAFAGPDPESAIVRERSVHTQSSIKSKEEAERGDRFGLAL